MVPGFRPTAIKREPTVESQYLALEQAAKKGARPQSGMWKRLQAALVLLQRDGQWGEVIPDANIPLYFRHTYGVTNLYCVDLSQTVRCFYTIVPERTLVFLDVVDHVEYDKWFPPKGRGRIR